MSATPSSSAAAAASNTPNKPPPTANVKPSRLPAPTLFVGPPSRNASHLSISRQQTQEPREPRKSTLGKNVEPASSTINDDTRSTNTRRFPPPAPEVKKTSEKNIEAKWKEIQRMLNEVESTTAAQQNVFGERHSAALDALKKAQVELARAWGRGNHQDQEQEQEQEHRDGLGGVEERREVGGVRKRASTGAESGSTALSDESREEGKGSGSLEDETAMDIRLARERRAANEGYFMKVEDGVRDVVKKLEVVAEAMRGVEGESRSLWSSGES
ncbi:uncharacterized protein MYCFIDRAFT_160856, partial [Pseudocercospora fijiensis CIRAD86]